MPSRSRSEYLRSVSRESVQEFELALLDHAAGVRKQINALEAQWLDDMKWAEVARLILDDPQLSSIGGHPVQEILDFTNQDVAEGPRGWPRRAAELPEFTLRNAGAA